MTRRNTSPWAAVVVNHNAGGHLSECVAALVADGADPVVVVDNASSDDSLSLLDASGDPVEIVRSPENLGYAAAANLGIEHAPDAEIVAVFNPDARLRTGSSPAVLERFTDPEVAAVGPRIYDSTGDTYPSARTVPSALDAAGHGMLGLVRPDNAFTRRYRQLDLDPGRARDVDWVSGAAIWLRRQALDEVEGWDADYFMYVEDVDLCWRLRRAGWRVVYEPGGQVVHVQGISTRHRPYRMLAAHHRSLFRFAGKRYRGARRLLLVPAAIILTVRALATMALHFTRSRLRRPTPQGCSEGPDPNE